MHACMNAQSRPTLDLSKGGPMALQDGLYLRPCSGNVLPQLLFILQFIETPLGFMSQVYQYLLWRVNMLLSVSAALPFHHPNCHIHRSEKY